MGTRIFIVIILLILNVGFSNAQKIMDGTYEFRDTVKGEATAVETVERFVFTDGEYYDYTKMVNYIKDQPAKKRAPQIQKDTSNRGSFVIKGGYVYLSDHSQVPSMMIDSTIATGDSITLTFHPRTSENCALVGSCWIIITELLPNKTENLLKKLAWQKDEDLPFQITIPKSKGRLYFKIFPPEYMWFELSLKANKNMVFTTYHKLNKNGDAPKAMVFHKSNGEGLMLQHIHHKKPRWYKRIK